MTIVAEPPIFDSALYSASLAYYGLPADYCRVFSTLHLHDPHTQQPLTNKHGDPVMSLVLARAQQASTQGKGVWVQVNRPYENAAQTDKGKPKKACNKDIEFLANVTLDFEYPEQPAVAHRIGLALAQRLVAVDLALPGLPVEDSGAGCHIVLPLPAIELSPETAERWNEAVACVVKTWILPEFMRLCAQEQITMDLSGYDISRVLSVPGTWRPRNPKKPDCAALQQGYLRRWLPPYTGTVYPVRHESAKLAERLHEAYVRQDPPPRTPSPASALLPPDPHAWITAYAATHPCADRSALFQRLVSAVYLKFGEETVHALRETIHALSGEKYNGRLSVELTRSLAYAKAHSPTANGTAVQRVSETKDKSQPPVLSGEQAIDQAILARDKAALYQLAPQIAELSELALSRVRLSLKEIWGPGFPLREFDDVLKAERRQARSRALRQVVVKSARELMATPFSPVEWAVPGVLPVGLIALAGKQKIGKSWLDHMLGIAVAAGGKAFGSIACKQGDVLYLALEDNERRLQDRIKTVLADGEDVPEGFYYATSWPRMDADGLAALEDWIVAHPAARLIIIDPWVKVKPRIKARPGETGYDADYEALEGLKRLADTYHLCILVQFHLRKAGAEDPFDELNGTSGITACADGFLSLKRARGEATASLWGTGRDYQEDVDLALRFERGIWTILGSASAYTLSQASREVIGALSQAGRPLRPKEIADLLDLPVGTIRKRLLDMKQRGEIQDTGKGYVANLCNGGNAAHGGSDGNGSLASSSTVALDRGSMHCPEGTCDDAHPIASPEQMYLEKQDGERTAGDDIQSGATNGSTAKALIASVPDITSVTSITACCDHSDTRDAVMVNKSIHASVDAGNADTITSIASVSHSSSVCCASPAPMPRSTGALPSGCSLCGAEVERYSPEGEAFCAAHFPGDDVSGPRPMTQAQFLGIAERCASVFPGGCTVHQQTPGCTLDEHVRRVAQEQQAAYRWARSRRG